MLNFLKNKTKSLIINAPVEPNPVVPAAVLVFPKALKVGLLAVFPNKLPEVLFAAVFPNKPPAAGVFVFVLPNRLVPEMT